jgi:CheY-like chemotaxis protein
MNGLPASILLVEDDADEAALFALAMRKLKPATELRVARDGDEAIRALLGTQDPRGSAPFVILDLKVPKRSGLEILEWIRRRRELRGTRVVVLTSSQLPEDLERARRAGLDRYYVKPISFPDLLQMVREILAVWRLLPSGGSAENEGRRP